MSNVTFVQATQIVASASNPTTLAYAQNTTAGSYLLAWVQNDLAASISIHDSLANVWTQIGSTVTLFGETWALFHVISSIGGANTVTVTNGANGGVDFCIAEYTGQSTSPLQASSGFSFNSGVTSFTSPNVTTNQNGEQLIFLGWTQIGPTITAGSGFSVEMANGTAGGWIIDSATVAAIPGTYNASATANSTTGLGGYLLAIQNASVALAPTFSPASGSYGPTQTVTISSATSGGTIFYTTDGSTPTHSSSSISNGSTISVATSETVKALASIATYSDSAVSSATYVIAGPLAATPTFNPVAGTYFTAQIVSITSATSGAIIYYTLDGSTPTTSSSSIANGGTVTVLKSLTLQAIAAAAAHSNSAIGGATYVITVGPTSNAQFQFASIAGNSDILQFKNAGGNIVSWIDKTGTGQGNLVNSGGGGGGGVTGILPSYGSYTLSVNSIGTVSAQNNFTGTIDFSGSDAAVVINNVLSAISSGGLLFFEDGNYNFNSVTHETTGGYSLYYCVGIPANAGSSSQYGVFRFVGATQSSVVGTAVQTGGVIFNVTSAALASAGSSSNIVIGFWHRPDIVNGTGNDIFFENIAVNFPSNQRGYEVAFDMEEADTVVWKNTVCAFSTAWGAPGPSTTYALPPNPSSAGKGCVGYRTPQAGRGNTVDFHNTWAVGYSIGYDIIGDHTRFFNVNGQLCYYMVQYGGVNAPNNLQYNATWVGVQDQDNYNGILIGANVNQGICLNIFGYMIEQDTSGPFTRQNDMIETHAGYVRGIITYSKTNYGAAIVNSPNLFGQGGGQGENFTTFNASVPGIVTPGIIQAIGGAPASASSTGTAGQFAWDATHFYICVATNTWVRVALATF